MVRDGRGEGEAGERRGNWVEIADRKYLGMLSMLQEKGVKVRDFQLFPHPWGEWGLGKQVWVVQSCVFGEQGTRVSVMSPNNIVVYKSSNKYECGLVQAIYLFPHPGKPDSTGIWIQVICNHHSKPSYPPGTPGYYFCLLGSVLGSHQGESCVNRRRLTSRRTARQDNVNRHMCHMRMSLKAQTRFNTIRNVWVISPNSFRLPNA
ncbi:hypothetical protein O181_039099 [Austropuccinia psidii MF-1]|uniref:Uncharacterized protein n=1 Tax=Austropuccinia psidii MF-1 TaxID=1389203 RepID=A0A9Q3D9N2_9BASI|nr:hypothetical protein [Austropuccinia psidii MF-1]